MQRSIAHDSTPAIKVFLLVMGLCPVLLLSTLWNNFSLHGAPAYIMIGTVLMHVIICTWYATQCSSVLFDERYLYIHNTNTVKKIPLEQIESVLPMRIAFPVVQGKVYIVNIRFTDSGQLHRVRFISKKVGFDQNGEAIPFLQSLRQAIATSKR